ncbi:MAG TPA: MFS transporter [Gaiellaceae bacterium]|nr:MFS transporter [Gaiellaceae bacterium]
MRLEGTEAPAVDLPVRRNTILLAATLAVNSCLFQLAAAVNSLTFVLVTGHRGLLGLGPAIFLASSGLAALPAGRAMDRFGRVPVMAAGFVVAAFGCSLIALATRTDSTVAVIVGMICTGAAGGVALLIRTAAGDMYPPERRARGIAYVIFGSVFGAILGPAVFSPLFAGKAVDVESLTVPWLAAAGLGLVALLISLFVRPDPKRIGELLATRRNDPPPQAAAPLREILRRPGVVPAMIAALASFSVMVSVMNLTGYVVVEHHHHPQDDVFPIIGAHTFGMFALVLFVGPMIDRIGRSQSLWMGLVLMGASCIGLAWFESVLGTGLLLFGLGLGWSISFVAATAQLADRAAPAERGKLLGFNDQLSALLGAGLALLGGFALDALGVTALAVGATAIVLLPLARLLRRERVMPIREPG